MGDLEIVRYLVEVEYPVMRTGLSLLQQFFVGLEGDDQFGDVIEQVYAIGRGYAEVPQ